MSSATLTFKMPKPVSRKVRLLRWLVRLYVCLDGLAAIVLVLGAAFWLGLAIDWTLEPSSSMRVLLWIVTILVAGYVAIRYLLGPFSRRLSNTSLALLLERNFPELNQSVITTVEAADRQRTVPVGNRELLENTSRKAAMALRQLKLRHIFQFGPLLWKSAGAIGIAVSIILFAVMQAESFGFWLQRIRLDSQLWPREVSLSVAGFTESDDDRFVNVARDDDFELKVYASIQEGHLAPEQVEIRYRLADGRRGRDTMTRIGNAIPGRDDAQLYRYEFKKVAHDLRFDVIGGDDRLRNLRLRVVERPQIFRMTLECEFPEYLGRPPQTIPVSGRVELPEGTTAVCRLEANKALQSVQVHDPAMQEDVTTKLDRENDRRVSFPVAVDQEDRVLLVTMLDQDGVENREPYRVVISAVLDQQPEVSVQLRGIGTAITPQARIPLIGQITDDYGLQSAWFEYHVDKKAATKRLLAAGVAGKRALDEIGNLDLALVNPETKRPLLELQPGQQLTLSVQAQDTYDLATTGHVGASQRFMLDVVTDSELRALLEKKELALRQRFESIYEKTVGVRELLDRIGIKESTESEQEAAEVERLRERDRLRVSGALQNVVQLSYETLGVADGFQDIVGELVNNRVDSEELTERLQQGIAEPLREIGGVLMPEFEAKLQELQSAIRQPDSVEKPLASAKAAGEEVVDAMKQVLDRMLELESYNELVELLRGIVADQEKVQQQTKAKRKQKLRSLLQDD